MRSFDLPRRRPRAARTAGGPRPRAGRPIYLRLLRLEHVRPNGWQRALLGEGAVAVGVVLTLADVASAWVILVLPVAVAVVVKANDVLAGELRSRPTPSPRAVPSERVGTARTPGPRRDPASDERKR